MFRFAWLWISSVLALAACAMALGAGVDERTGPAIRNSPPRIFQAKGIVVAVKLQEREVTIKHEPVPGYMPAMTMPFSVKDTNELAGLAPGESVSFRLVVTQDDGWVDQIRKLGPVLTNEPTATAEFWLTENSDLLKPGDPLPGVTLTNQFGQTVTTTQFKGQVLALNFLFTRCPFPTFCPRMATEFAEAQRRLLARTSGPTNWHLLTISFDPDFDRPSVLRAYAENHAYDPAHWTFATGAVNDIKALGDRFGLKFFRDEDTGGITHNLRAVVVDPTGRVQKVFTGFQWTSRDLVAEMLRAAKVTPRAPGKDLSRNN